MKQFSLSASDVGKSINDIKDNFLLLSIIDDIQQVIKSNEIMEKKSRLLTYEIINHTGGKIVVKSKIGAGTEFQVYLKTK